MFLAKDKYNFYIKNYPYPQGNTTTHPSYTLVSQIHELVTVYLRCNKTWETNTFSSGYMDTFPPICVNKLHSMF